MSSKGDRRPGSYLGSGVGARLRRVRGRTDTRMSKSLPGGRTRLGERTRRSRAPTRFRLCRDGVPTLPMSGIGGWRLAFGSTVKQRETGNRMGTWVLR